MKTEMFDSFIGSDLYRSLFDFSATPSAVFDDQFTHLLSNRSFDTQLGLGFLDDGQQSVELVDLFENREEGQLFQNKLQTRHLIRRLETRLEAKKRGGFSVLLSGRGFEFNQKKYYQISFTDISRQEDLQNTIRREHARLSSLMENLSIGLFFVDLHGILINVNRVLGKILQIDEGKLEGNHYKNLFALFIKQASEPEVLQKRLSKIVKMIEQCPEVEFSFDQELSFHYELALFPVRDRDGFSLGWGGLLKDISDLRKQVDWKMELLSILSHDIRSPLATLKGHVNVLKDNYDQWGPDLAREFLKIMDRSVDNLSKQVDRNLALTRVEGGELGLRPQTVDPGWLIDDVIGKVAGLDTNAKIMLDIPAVLPKVRADPARIEEVLVNLLDNAIRYSPPDKCIEISVTDKKEFLKFSVLDYGKGIPELQQKNIFDKYVRDEDEDSGTGIGLYICRKIVEAHGGQIRVQSPLKGMPVGTEFYFTLPAAYEIKAKKEKTESTDRRVVQKKDNQDAHILVVEDEVDFQVLFQQLISEEGYQVEVVSEGISALDIIKMSPPNLIILDWMLPGMNGLTVCRNIRRWSNVPIIVVTSSIQQEDLITALDAGADDYLIKPFDRKELFARMRALLRRGDVWRESDESVSFGMDGLLIDFTSKDVWVDDQYIDLTKTEYDLLEYMARHPRQLLTYEKFLSANPFLLGENAKDSLFVYVSRLRKKIERDPKKPKWIVTRWGIGYLFMPK
jgi:DNA-binding response OmpR family regulator/signal transduction histidine kinase